MRERRKILEKNMRPIENHVQLSEYHLIKTPEELNQIIAKVCSFKYIFLLTFNNSFIAKSAHRRRFFKDTVQCV